MVRGLQSAGVAATVKHAPGKGHVDADTHHGLAAVSVSRAILEEREFVPFRAAFTEGVRLAMSGHFALPAISRRDDLPSTLSRAVMTDLLRGDLGFGGVTISDALDMHALAQGPSQALDVVAAVRAGVDLLLAGADEEALARIESTLVHAGSRGLFDHDESAAANGRIIALRRWLADAVAKPPSLDVVGNARHRALASSLAARSITLVRDAGGLDAVRTGSGGGPILAIMPRPADLTPADTSSTIDPGLASALRRVRSGIDEVVVGQRPSGTDIAAIRDRVLRGDVGAIVVGTIDGHRQPEQLRLVEALAGTGTPVIAAALRGPWDVAAYPDTVTAFATYSILPTSLEALARVIAGRAEAQGRLPVATAPEGVAP
jgi:beta-N-acetylhexosaminidase